MSDCVTGNNVADVFVESMAMQLEAFADDGISDGEANEIAAEIEDREIISVDDGSSDEVQFIGEKKIASIQGNIIKLEEPSIQLQKCSSEMGEEQEMNSSSDSDYHLPSGCCSSEEDEEAAEINNKLMEFKNKLKSGELFTTHVTETEQLDGCDLLDGNSTPYADSSDEDESFEEGSDGEVFIKEDNFLRFDRKAVVPVFVLGMKFSDKKLFKDAIIQYGIAERKCIKFIKDEGNRVRAVCDWPMCTWVCLLKKTTLSDSWLVTSLNDEHTCPKRRDNKLVTSRRIADRFEELIKANSAQSLHHLRATVQQEMFANVSLSKCKRAKQIVMGRWLDRTKGEYTRVYDFQEELLRSNPGSTIVIKLDPEFEDLVF